MESDGRRVRGDRTRRAITHWAASRASLEGLESLSLGRLAADLGISKSGIQAAFSTKEALQVATVAAATDIFVENVVAPAARQPHGKARLWALIDNWLGYVGNKVLPGGCFLAATVPEFDSRPGPVRDALARSKQAWLGLLASEVQVAQRQHEVDAAVDAHLLAFEIDALLTMANTVCNLEDHQEALRSARTLLEIRLGR